MSRPVAAWGPPDEQAALWGEALSRIVGRDAGSEARAPSRIWRRLRMLCAEIAPEANPAFIPSRPRSDALPNRCFETAQRQVAGHGGSLITGYRLWIYVPAVNGVMAETHAAWESPDGELIDVAAARVPTDRVLFVRAECVPQSRLSFAVARP